MEDFMAQGADKIIKIANLIADFVLSGGTYRPEIGMYGPTYTWHEGHFSRSTPAEDPREAMMYGGTTPVVRHPCGRDEFIDIVKAKGTVFLHVLCVSNHPTDHVSAEMAEQILDVVSERGRLDLKNENFHLQLSFKNGLYYYRCTLPVMRSKLEIHNDLDRAGTAQWLMKHQRRIFLSFVAD